RKWVRATGATLLPSDGESHGVRLTGQPEGQDLPNELRSAAIDLSKVPWAEITLLAWSVGGRGGSLLNLEYFAADRQWKPIDRLAGGAGEKGAPPPQGG